MEEFNFEQVKVLLGEVDRNARDGLKSALFHRGFRSIAVADKVSTIHETTSNDEADLLICSSEYDDGDVHDLIHKIRHHEVGSNPFVLVITLIGEPSKELIRKVIDSGSDDILVKPISSSMLYDRIVKLTRERKRFVVTSDYIGPNRRKKHRPGTKKIPEIDVPNSLQVLALGDVDTDYLQRDIERCSKIVSELKLERNAVQIDYLVKQILSSDTGETAEARVGSHFDRLVSVSEDIRSRLERFSHAERDEKAEKDALCQKMVDVAGRLRADLSSRDPQDIDLLTQTAEDIKRAFHDDKIAA
jgi:DNA-binding response OmpR family regulator